MAHIIPNLEGIKATSGGMQRELDVVKLLRDALPDDFVVFHGVLMSNRFNGRQHFGEVDVLVLAPSGLLGLIEVKAGRVLVSDKGISKDYGDKNKNVGWQLNMQYGTLRGRLKDAGLDTHIAQYLVVPDMVLEGQIAKLPRVYVVDKHRLHSLPTELLRDLSPSTGADKSHLYAKLKLFLNNQFALPADPSQNLQWLQESVQELAEGMALWVPRIHAPSGMYAIQATAGAGKTQLALRVLQEAARAGMSARYVCFNRPLADHLRMLLKDTSVSVGTFHEFAIEALRALHGEVLDFSSPQVFAQAETAFVEQAACLPRFDVLMVDEAQDFAPAWLTALAQQRTPSGRVYVLQDEAQRLYMREVGDAPALPSAVRVECWDNFRTPRRIVQLINLLRLTREPVAARCPIDGQIPGFHTWPAEDEAGMATLERVVSSLLAEKIKPENIVLLSYAGLKRSRLLLKSHVAQKALRKFSGQYDAQGGAIWTPGDLLAESVHRFKGQAAPVVVLCEVDFEVLDALTKNRLLVGMSRAQWRLEIVLSERAEHVLRTAILG